MKQTTLERLAELENKLRGTGCRCVVLLPDGSETETTIDAWLDHREEWEWMSPVNCDRRTLFALAAVAYDVAEQCQEDGNTADANTLYHEAASLLALYED